MARYLRELAKQFPAVAVVGPRQSGKTTLVRWEFPDYIYVTLEEPDKKKAAQNNPRDFFSVYSGEKGVIIDEAQEVPELFYYLQSIVDHHNRPGHFILAGS